MQTHKADTP